MLPKEITIKTVNSITDVNAVAELAHIIWHEHYTDIIGADQVVYMLKKYQTAEKIMSDINNGVYIYYLAEYEGDNAGYCSVGFDANDDRLFLSKLYVKKQFRKRGIASAFMYEIKRFAQEKELSMIWLTVNKNNKSSIEAYIKIGFKITGDIMTDIGCGYYMDDHVMEYKIGR